MTHLRPDKTPAAMKKVKQNDDKAKTDPTQREVKDNGSRSSNTCTDKQL